MRMALAMIAAAALIPSPADADQGRTRDPDRLQTGSRSGDRGRSDEITEAFMIGRWADSRDCRRYPVVFSPKGEFVAEGGGRGRWSLVEGNTLVMTGPGGRQVLPLRRVSDNELLVTSNGASSYRC